ncbi:MAG TPA: PAS domain-containing protein, partial [bacterium]|nr:PAS domain-containing protein [bacterium]
MEGRPGFPSPPIAPLPPDPARSRTIQLLAAVEAPCGIHARRTGAGWALEPLPDLQVVGREGLDLTALGAALLGWLTGPDTPARFTVDLPATPRRTFFLPRKGLRRLVVYRLDQSAEPSELLLVPCDHRKAASKPGGYRELLARHAHLAYDERPVPSEAKTLRSWENLADALQHGLLICDGDLTIRYLNASAREHLSLDPASALGRRAADLPWDRETQEALLRLPAIPTEFHRQARMRRGQQWIPLDLNGRSLDGGGLVLECSFARLPLRHSGEYAPLGTVPPVAAPQPEPVWQGT